MNRLHKKCFIASTGVHLLLALILLVGPAFLSSKAKVEETQYLEFIPSRLVDGPVHAGGGATAPRVQTPTPPQPAPAPRQPDPPPEREPDPPRHVATPQSDPDPDPVPSRRRPAISTTPVVRKSNSKTTSKTTTATDNRDQQVSDNRRRAAALISQAKNSLRSDLSSSTEVVMPGEGFGEAYASYASAVKSVYEQAWIPPEDTTDDNAITKVTVTIGNTGKVLSASIIRPSGETVVDRSVQRTLDRVTFIAPFPEGAKEKQRTYTINFNLKAKRGLG